MLQDIITYVFLLYAVTYTGYYTVKMFIPQKEAVKNRNCSSCAGCKLKDECS